MVKDLTFIKPGNYDNYLVIYGFRVLVIAHIYTIRLKFSNFFIHHYFQNQMFENFTYAFNMSSDAQIHVSRRVCVLFSRPGVATLRLKNHANHVPSIPRASTVVDFCLV